MLFVARSYSSHGGSRRIVRTTPLLELSNLSGSVLSVLVVLGLSGLSRPCLSCLGRALLGRLAPPYKGGGVLLTCRVLLGLG